MAVPTIRVEQLGKRYRLTHGRETSPYRTLRESLVDAAKAPFRKRQTVEEFWALQDVTFEIQPGEIVGIIGRNGSGKSTLLKILSRITKPTTGHAELNGRVGSLLEVGTGFHPELTGRDNIYLNGSILGMARREIAAKFDEIVAFAEVEKFLDTPVKRYSSGMYVRLAFAVAAHLEPEILIVDEVLAVGDGPFQKKCLGKMGEVAQGGRTVLFVSHSMQTVTRLCRRGVLLDGGRIKADGPVDHVVQAYLSSGECSPTHRTWPNGRGPGGAVARLCSVRVRDTAGETIQIADIRRPIGLEIEYEVYRGGVSMVLVCHVANGEGVCLFNAVDAANRHGPPGPGRYRSVMWIPGNFLAEGTHVLSPALSDLDANAAHFVQWDAVAFEVVDSLEGDSARGTYAGSVPGLLRPILDWQTTTLEGGAA